MKLQLIALATAFSLAVATAPAVTGASATFDRTLSTGSAPNVTVNSGAGNIHIHAGSDSQVHIIGHVHANSSWLSSSGDAESRVQQIVANPPIAQNGNDIVVGEQHNSELYHNISIDYDVTVPRASALNSNTGSGDITVEDAGATLKAHSGSGNIHANGVQGAATLGTGSGNIAFAQSGPGDVKAETGSGDIELRNISGALYSRTGSGGIDVQGQPTSDWKLSTGSGTIRMGVGSARFTLDASTGSGSINVAQAISMQSSLNRHHVSGSVNGGGPTIHASTGSGDIQIK